MKILYVTWDGPGAAYLQSLFLPILSKLQRFGMEFDVLQFTWGDTQRMAAVENACRTCGVGYESVIVRRGLGGVGPFVSALAGARLIRKRALRGQFDAVLARSTMPALATLLASRKSPFSFAFDADGLPLDERVEFAHRSPTSIAHRFLRDVEYQMLLQSRTVLVRTAAARNIMIGRAGAGADVSKYHVVPNGRNPEIFKPAAQEERNKTRARLGISPSALVLVYVGSIGPQYRIGDVLQLTREVSDIRDDTRLLIITNAVSDAAAILNEQAPSLTTKVSLMSATPNEVPHLLAAADIALAFRQNSFSMQAVAPIKLGEYLLSGLPIVGTPGIGDVDEAIRTGVFFPVGNYNSEAIGRAAQWCLGCIEDRERLSAKARNVGIKRFSLDHAVEGYHLALRALAPE